MIGTVNLRIPSTVPFRRPKWVLAAILCIYMVLASGIALTRFPWADEGYFAGPGINLVRHGYMGTAVMEPEVKWSAFAPFLPLRMDKHTYWHPPLYFVAQATWYRVFGASLFSMRYLSVAWGGIALLSTFVLVRLLTKDDSVSLLATTMVGVDFLFLNSAAVGRMDMMAVALALTAYVLYLSLRERHLPLAFVLGHAFVTASGLTHANGVLPLAAMVFLNVFYDYKRITLRLLLLGSIPYVIGGIGWGIYIMHDPEAFLTQFGTNMRVYPPSASIFQSLRKEVVDQYLEPYGFSSGTSLLSKLKIITLLTYLTGIVGVIVSPLRREAGIKTLLSILAIYVLIMTFGVGHKTWSYSVWVIPIYAALFAAWFVRCWRNEIVSHSILRPLLGVVIALQLAICCFQIVKDPYRKVYLPAMERVRLLDDGSGFIMGSAEIAFGLGFSERIVDDANLGFVTGKDPIVIVMNSWYWSRSELKEAENPGLYHYLKNSVPKEFEKVFENEVYKIYAKRAHAGRRTPS